MSRANVNKKLLWILSVIAAAIIGYMAIEFVVKPMRERVEES